MDTAETAMVVGLVAIAIGIAVGYQVRAGRRPGPRATTAAAAVEVAPARERYQIALQGPAGAAGCGCS